MIWNIVQHNTETNEWNTHDPNTQITGSFKVSSDIHTLSTFEISITSTPIHYLNPISPSVSSFVILPTATDCIDMIFYFKNQTSFNAEISTVGGIYGSSDDDSIFINNYGSATIHSDGLKWNVL